jgi:hypothetical protein
MTKTKRRSIIVGVILLAGFVFIYQSFVGCTSHTPRPHPPQVATNVYFQEFTAWQSWDYLYRFDAPPQVCQQFAVELMKCQSHRRRNCAIKTNVFTTFPIGLRRPPAWFDVSTVTNGLLLTADDWFYAVIDQSRGRLYYYNGN